MNFEAFNKGVYSMLVGVSMAITSAIAPTTPLASPQDLSASQVSEAVHIQPPATYNLEPPSESTTSSSLVTTYPLPSSETEAIPTSVVTVEKPATVHKPLAYKKTTPSSPSPSPQTNKKEPTSKEPSVKPTLAPAENPSPVPTLKKLADGAEKLFQMANQHRQSLGLPAFEKEERICQIAEARAPQIHEEVFGNGPIHKGFRALNLSYWATENAAAYDSIERNFKFWLSDQIHRKAIEGNSKYSCVACSGTSCSQIFTSFIPK